MSTIVDAHELFVNVYLDYNDRLCNSISHLQLKGKLKQMPNKFYNYILVDADLLYKLLNSFDTNKVNFQSISSKDLADFKQAIIYIGKGVNDRKYSHLIEALSLIEGRMNIKKVNAKYTKIVNIWNKKSGVIILHLFSDSNHYISLSRENAMIKAVGKSLTNLISGSVYGLMKNKWSQSEILNFGEMLLYFSLRQCIIERPNSFFPKDFKNSKNNNSNPKKYTFKHIFDLLLDL